MSPETGRPRFQQQQLDFTAHIRDPDAHPVPNGVSHRRMGIYTELLFNNINHQLSSNFPVLCRITREEHWSEIVRDFMRRHRSQTPLFTEVGQEFLAYLRDEREPSDADWPFMLELAHYEYVELAVAISPADESRLSLNPNGDLIVGQPVVAPTVWNLTYTWPVHQIGPDHLPEAPPAEPTHLVVYRDRLDEVHFLEINVVTQRLLQLFKEHPEYSGLDVLRTIAGELGHPGPESILQDGAALLNELRERNVILGTRSVTDQ